MKFRKLMAVTLIGMMSASLMACGGNSKETGNKTAAGIYQDTPSRSKAGYAGCTSHGSGL